MAWTAVLAALEMATKDLSNLQTMEQQRKTWRVGQPIGMQEQRSGVQLSPELQQFMLDKEEPDVSTDLSRLLLQQYLKRKGGMYG